MLKIVIQKRYKRVQKRFFMSFNFQSLEWTHEEVNIFFLYMSHDTYSRGKKYSAFFLGKMIVVRIVSFNSDEIETSSFLKVLNIH